MSQSATLYRISLNDFEKLKENGRKNFNLLASSEEYKTFQGTFMGLEFVLSKNRDDNQTELIEQIFNPDKSIGGKDLSGYNLSSMNEMEILELLENDSSVWYHSPEKVKDIDEMLSLVSDIEFVSNYDPDELNTNDIYPSVWNRNTAPDAALNEKHILNDFTSLKSFFYSAAKEHDYVLCIIE